MSNHYTAETMRGLSPNWLLGTETLHLYIRRGAKDAIIRIKKYIEQGYTRAVVFDLSKYFDTLNHTIKAEQWKTEL